jgi:two-component sensor histidine kinase
MTFHELAVNAAKYGALSVDKGRLELSWAVDMAAEDRQLELNWREFGGPEVTASPRAGFGSRLIQTGIARDLGGEARLDFNPAGVCYALRAPLSARIALA